MNDKDALYAAILAHAAEDTPRLMLADWLDENTPASCPECEGDGRVFRWGPNHQRSTTDRVTCPYCRGSGSSGNRERAEFIRVQRELARLGPPCWGSGHCCQRCDDLKPKERHWIESNRQALQEEWKPFVVGLRRQGWTDDSTPVLLFDRGFVAEVRCEMATWRGGDCENCGGRGHFQTSGSYAECPRCLGPNGKGSGTTPGIGGQVMARWPVECVRVTDREPEPQLVWLSHADEPRVTYYGWCVDPLGEPLDHYTPAELTAVVWDALDGRPHQLDGTPYRWKLWATPADAHVALSAFLIAEAKKAAQGAVPGPDTVPEGSGSVR